MILIKPKMKQCPGRMVQDNRGKCTHKFLDVRKYDICMYNNTIIIIIINNY